DPDEARGPVRTQHLEEVHDARAGDISGERLLDVDADERGALARLVVGRRYVGAYLDGAGRARGRLHDSPLVRSVYRCNARHPAPRPGEGTFRCLPRSTARPAAS